MNVFFAVISAALSFISMVPYLRDIFRKKTKPHPLSFLVWSITSAVWTAIAVNAGAGVAALLGVVDILLNFLIFILALREKQKWVVKKFDVVCFVVAMVSLVLWLFERNFAGISVTLITVAEVVGFMPTIRKSWSHPFSETLSSWILTLLASILFIFALETYSFVTLANDVAWIPCYAILILVLIVRRKKIGVKK